MSARRRTIETVGTPAGRNYLWTAAALFACTRLGLWLTITPAWSDTALYYRYVALGIDHGYVAYQDFIIEYPPLAYWWMCVPRFLQAEPLSPNALQEIETFHAYQRAYRGLMAIVDAAVSTLVCLLLITRGGHGGGLLAICYVVASACLGHLLYDRLDNVLTLLLAGWAWCWLRASGGTERPQLYSAASYLLLGLSISFKLIPVLLIPYALWHDWSAGDGRQALRSGLILALAIILPFLVHWPSAGSGTLVFLGYHAERGIQVESVYGSFLAAAHHLGGDARAVHRHGAWDIEGSGSAALQTASTCALILLLAVCVGLAVWRRKTFRRSLAYAGGCTLLVASAAFSKVLSPQYYVWIVPLALLASADLLPPARWTSFLPWAVLLLTLTTTWLFPYHYFSHIAGEQGALRPINAWGLIPGFALPAVIVLCVRNALLHAVSMCLLVALVKKMRQGTRAQQAADLAGEGVD